MQETINKAKALVKQQLGEDTSGHDYYHVARVVKLALEIARKEGVADLDMVELLAWLHDLADVKLVDDAIAAKHTMDEWLKHELTPNDATLISSCLSEIGFKGGQMNATHVFSKIVNDADKLDAMGAVGIARCFAFGAYKQQAMYAPTIKPQSFETEEAYRQLKSTSYNHISEKLLKLKDYLYTTTAKELAKSRHDFLMQFVAQFEEEVGV